MTFSIGERKIFLLPDSCKDLSRVNLFAGMDIDFFNRAALIRGHWDLHLHAFEYSHGVADLDMLAFLDEDLPDVARNRRIDFVVTRRCRGSSGAATGAPR